MEMLMLLIPFAGTSLGAAMVFFLRKNLSLKIQKTLLGFAAGVMVAASIWSLLIPSIDMATSQNVIPWVPALIGFILGITFLLILDTVIPHLHVNSTKPEGIGTNKVSKTSMMLFAVTLHNIPEGMAVGVAVAGALNGNAMISFSAALALSVGIAIQNFPEGAIISMPLCSEGMGKSKSFFLGVLSGVVEPIAALFTILFVSKMTIILPYLLAFAAGAMLYVVVEELIPESQSGDHTNIGTISFAVGFALMMVLDIALG